MAKYTIQKTTLDAIAAAIVDQTGDTGEINQSNMAAKVRSIGKDKITSQIKAYGTESIRQDILAQVCSSVSFDTMSMPDLVVDISMEDGSNMTDVGFAYKPTISGGTFENGKFILNGRGYLSVPTPFMSGSNPWTVAFRIDAYTPYSNAYARFARGNNDVPSLFYTKSVAKSQAKLAQASANINNVDMLDTTIASSTSDGAVLLNIPRNAPTLFVFRNDGEYVTLWINGIKTLQEASSRYTSDKYASNFAIGDQANGSYYMSHLECSLFKAWSIALTDTDIIALS